MDSQKSNGYAYLTYRIDWKNSEMQLVDFSPLLSELSQDPLPITPVIIAIRTMLKSEHHYSDENEHNFILDLRCKGDKLTVNLHHNDYDCMLHPSHDILERVLRQSLTRRETEIAVLLFEASTIRSIASRLHIAEGTVKRTIYNIYHKLNVTSQVELIREIYQRLSDAQATDPKQE